MKSAKNEVFLQHSRKNDDNPRKMVINHGNYGKTMILEELRGKSLLSPEIFNHSSFRETEQAVMKNRNKYWQYQPFERSELR